MILFYSHSPSVDSPQAMGKAVLVEQGWNSRGKGQSPSGLFTNFF